MKQITVVVVLMSLISLCSCFGGVDESYVECSRCGAEITSQDTLCSDCITQDVYDHVFDNYVCFDYQDWQEFCAQYGGTEAYKYLEELVLASGNIKYSDITNE